MPSTRPSPTPSLPATRIAPRPPCAPISTKSPARCSPSPGRRRPCSPTAIASATPTCHSTEDPTMLKGIPHILSPDLLHALQAMGHGDEITIVDGNYPGQSAGPRLIRADGHSGTDLLAAILSVLPLDDFVPDPV